MKKTLAKKNLGQNFLISDLVIDQIIKYLSIEDNQNIIEIGPGRGAISFHIFNKTKNYFGIEKDQDMLKYLYPKIDEKNIILDDILKINFSSLFEEKFKLVGNIPYNISSKILEKIVDNREKFISVYLMIQKEVADRIVAQEGRKAYGRLSIFMQIFFEVEILFEISPECFSPKPKVVSSFIKLVPRKEISYDIKDYESFSKFVKKIFNSRRKKIANNINIPKKFSNPLLQERAEDLSINKIVMLYNLINNYG
jgi:16S rRNA (adenine1518-N6/adenine1519-N6)-dimethyltransferase